VTRVDVRQIVAGCRHETSGTNSKFIASDHAQTIVQVSQETEAKANENQRKNKERKRMDKGGGKGEGAGRERGV
jgi:hypothetical protein